MIGKFIKVDDRTHRIFLLESFRQSTKKKKPISMAKVLKPLAERINKKQEHVE